MRRMFLAVMMIAFPTWIALHAQVPSILVNPSGATESVSEEIELTRFKKQALQSVSVGLGTVADIGDDGLSNQFLDVSIGTGIPLGSFENIIGVKPRTRIDWIDAADTFDVPNQLYQFEVQFFYRRPIHDRLSAMAIVSPAIRSDLTTSDESFRVFALGLLNWQCVPDRFVLSGGAVYLGRADLPVVPAIGARWTPNRLTQLDLQFPTSTFARRLAKEGSNSETWAYLSAGLGGNTWAVTRRDKSTDELSLRDLRITTGIEKRLDGGGGWNIEVGYALARRIEFERAEQEIELDDAIVVQGRWSY